MRLRSRGSLSLLIIAIALGGLGLWRANTGAAGTPTMALSPAGQTQLYPVRWLTLPYQRQGVSITRK